MKRIIAWLKSLTYVTYRLTIHTGGHVLTYHGTDRSILLAKGRNCKGAVHWALYKKGPLRLPERLVDSM